MALIETTGQFDWPRLELPVGGIGRLGALRHLPRDLALARLAYALKRPLFALPVYRLVLAGQAPTALMRSGDWRTR